MLLVTKQVKGLKNYTLEKKISVASRNRTNAARGNDVTSPLYVTCCIVVYRKGHGTGQSTVIPDIYRAVSEFGPETRQWA